MGDDDYYYYHYDDDDNTFEGYEVTSKNPGIRLVFITTGYTVFCVLIGLLIRIRKKENKTTVPTGVEYSNQDDIPEEEKGEVWNDDYDDSHATISRSPSDLAYQLMTNLFEGYDDEYSMNERSHNSSLKGHQFMLDWLLGNDEIQKVQNDEDSSSLSFSRNSHRQGRDEKKSGDDYKLLNDSSNSDKKDSSDVKESDENYQYYDDEKSFKRRVDSRQSSKAPSQSTSQLMVDSILSPGKLTRQSSHGPPSRRSVSRNPSRRGIRQRNISIHENDQVTFGIDDYFPTSSNGDSICGSPNSDITSKDGRVHKTKNKETNTSGYEQMTDSVSSDDISSPTDHSSSHNDLRFNAMKMIQLAAPWTLSSFFDYASSIITISIISHLLGVAEMLCYSYVWFILNAANILSTAIYESLYKHVNNAAASGTEEGFNNAGRYIRISLIVNTVLSIPVAIGLITSMSHILGLFGYGDNVTDLAQNYTIVAVISNFIRTLSSFVTVISDVEHHADFDAMYDFVDYGADIVLVLFVVPIFQPTLFQFGLIHLAQDIVSIISYYAVTWFWFGWFDKYKTGLFTTLSYDKEDKMALATLIYKAIPMAIDEVTDEFEWFVLTYFAARIGPAESATWILSSYLWGIITVLPDCISSASEMRISHLLSKGYIPIAQRLTNLSMILTFTTATIGVIILYFTKNVIVHAMSNDETLSGMLLELVPYFALCQPFISVTTTSSYLNRALGMYKRSTKVELLLTCFVTIPAAYLSTVYYGFNIEGLIAASFIGYATLGIFTLAILMNADWNKAERKNKIMGGQALSEESGINKSPSGDVSALEQGSAVDAVDAVNAVNADDDVWLDNK